MNYGTEKSGINLKGVTVIEPVGAHGGAHFYDISLCRAIRQAGFDAILATCDLTPKPVDIPLRHSYVRIFGKSKTWLRAWRFFLGSIDALRWGSQRGHLIVHLHFYGFELLQLVNIILVKLFRRKLVITVHDVEVFDGSHRVGFLAKYAYNSADILIAHNETTREALINRAAVPFEKIATIRHGDHLELQSKSMSTFDARNKLNLSHEAFVIGFVGQIKEVKGLDLLIRAVSFAKPNTLRPLLLLIAGKPWRNDFGPYQSLINELDLVENTSLHIRYLEDEELPIFFCAADLMVLPYRKIYQSGVILMAMALKRPILVSDLPGLTEMVEHDVNGRVFTSGSHEALSKELVWAERNQQRITQQASKAFERMSREHAWSLIGRQTTELYHQLLRRQEK